MTTYFVTTGVSMRENSRCWKLREDDHLEQELLQWGDLGKFHEKSSISDLLNMQDMDQAIKYVKCMHLRRKNILDRLGENRETAQVVMPQILRDDFDETCWTDSYKRLPAELATLYKLFSGYTEYGEDIVKRDDEFVFLYGTTNIKDAVVCAELLKAMPIVNQRIENPSVQIRLNEQPHNWDPMNSVHFSNAMEKLWDQIMRVDHHRLVLTGGYKGVLLDLAVRRGVEPLSRGAEKMYYLHENGAELITYIPTIPAENRNTKNG